MVMSEQAHPRITTDPDVMFGKPVIRGTRIPVEHVLRKLGSGMPVAEILDTHPGLSEKDACGAVQFAADYVAGEEVLPTGEDSSREGSAT
jgi:uncharacterized protein (DUF433 family)